MKAVELIAAHEGLKQVAYRDIEALGQSGTASNLSEDD
jgi:hypothetical protein